MEYKGYTVLQMSNNHVHVYKDGKMVMHVPAYKKREDSELTSIVDFYLQLREDRTLKRNTEDSTGMGFSACGKVPATNEQ